MLLPLPPNPQRAALMATVPLSIAQPDPLPQPRSHCGTRHNGSVYIPGALGEPEGKVDPSRAQALPGGSEQLPLWQRPQGPGYTGHTSEQQERGGLADRWAKWGCREGSWGLRFPSPGPIIYPLLNPQFPLWLGVWEQCTLQTVGAVLA